MRENDIYNYIVEDQVKTLGEEFFLRSIKNVCDAVPPEHESLILWYYILDVHRLLIKSASLTAELQKVAEEKNELLTECEEALSKAKTVIDSQSKALVAYETVMAEAQTKITRLIEQQKISNGH